MNSTYIIDQMTGNTFVYVPLSVSTFHTNHMKLDAAAVVAEVDSIVQDAFAEMEWHTIITKPRVKRALRRMAAEARQQYYAGETEEGGFGIE